MEHQGKLLNYRVVSTHADCLHSINIISTSEAQQVPQDWREDFIYKGKVQIIHSKTKNVFATTQKAVKIILNEPTFLRVSEKSSEEEGYLGIVSDLIGSSYKFSRKSTRPILPLISLDQNIPHLHHILKLASAKAKAVELANGRGDIQGTPQYFEAVAEQIAKTTGSKLTVIKGDGLITEGFRLMHAVGRGSKNIPVFINLSYQGNPDSTDWVAFIGKGVCFDTGGYDIKSASSMLSMYLDKHGAASVLAAFQAIVQDKPIINLTCSVGMVQNFIGNQAYRPSDIITSRKGLTVEIGNTDAEGRLVLADCMHWTQEKFKVKILIELSTLTGAIGSALGRSYAGLFTNNNKLLGDLKQAGESTTEEVWHLPINNYHKELVTGKYSDLTNSSGVTQAGSSQAAAFLKNFVEKETEWVHLDIASTAIVNKCGTGYGARLLVQYITNQLKRL